MISSEQLERVAVIGTSCSGKTTFARLLAQRLNAPHIELDSLYWAPNWTSVPLEQFRAVVDQATGEPHWICDGNYRPVRDFVWRRATALVWLNYSFPLVFGRALRRTISRCIRRTQLFAGNRESIRLQFLSRHSILLWILRTHWRHQRDYPALFQEPQNAHLRVVELRTPSAASRFLSETNGLAATPAAIET